MQAIGREPQRAPDGAPVHYGRHRPEQTTLYRLVQQHAATRFIHWLIDEEFRRCVGGDGGGTCDAGSNSRPELIRRGSRANGTGSLTLVYGGRAALERELLWLVALGNADTPRAIELQRMLSARRPGSLRLVGQIGDASGGADDAEATADR